MTKRKHTLFTKADGKPADPGQLDPNQAQQAGGACENSVSYLFGKKQSRTKRCFVSDERPVEDLSTGTSSSSSAAMPKADEIKPLRTMVKDFFISNKLSAKEAIQLAGSATAAGAAGSEDIATAAGTVKKHWKNAHRDLLRRLLRGCDLPLPYYCPVRVKNIVTLASEVVYMPVMLPHEMLQSICAKASCDDLKLWTSSPEFEDDVSEFCATWGCTRASTFAIGLHGDGVPFKAKMEDSLEQLSWSFASDPTSDRILFAVIPKSFVTGEDTFKDLFSIFTASMKQLALGVWPSMRLDGTAWLQSDLKRSKLGGNKLSFSAVLLQIRGDWMFYKQVFNFPSWNAKRMCWKCEACSDATECNFKNPSSDAGWRVRRVSQDQFFAQLRQAGVEVCPIFRCPQTALRHVQIDWLHTMDLGVTQSFLGNFMFEIMNTQLQGATQRDRVAVLWQSMCSWYARTQPPSKLQKLTLEMLKQSGKGPKLRTKAGECRYLVPFGAELAAIHKDASMHFNVVFQAMEHLQAMYECLDMDPYPAEQAAQHCHQFSLLYAALSAEAEQTGNSLGWVIKPKFHLMIELLEIDCIKHRQSPRKFWTYLDESWGGTLADIAERRGGPKSAVAIAESVLQRYRAWVTK